MTRVLITGSSGDIGTALTRALLADPSIEHVAGLDQHPSTTTHPNFIRADVRQPFHQILRDHRINTVVHAAFVVQPIHDHALERSINLDGTRNALQSAVDTHVRTFIHLSSATVYGAHPDHTRPLPESAPLRPNRGLPYAHHKAATEDLVRQFQTSFDSTTILRPSFIVQPGTRNALFNHLTRRLAILPKEQAPLQLTHMGDLVEIIRRSIHHNGHSVYNVGAQGALTATEMMRRLHHPTLHLPISLIRPLSAAAWHLRLSRLTDVPAAALPLLIHPWRVDSNAVQRALGYTLRYTTASAFEAFREHDARLQARRRHSGAP